MSGDQVASEEQQLWHQEESQQKIVESPLRLGKWEVLKTGMQARHVVDSDDDDDGTQAQERCSSLVWTDSLLLLSRIVV